MYSYTCPVTGEGPVRIILAPVIPPPSDTT